MPTVVKNPRTAGNSEFNRMQKIIEKRSRIKLINYYLHTLVFLDSDFADVLFFIG